MLAPNVCLSHSAGMSIHLHWLLPNSNWVIAAICRGGKEVRTFLATEEGREAAEGFIAQYAGAELRVLAGRARTILSSVPNFEHVLDVCAIGVRLPLSQLQAIKDLQNAPAILFEYRGKLVSAWRFAKPIPTADANKAERFLAERFGGERLNFFIPIPVGIHGVLPVINFDRRCIDPKNIEAELMAAEDEAFLSATSAPKQRSWAIEPIAQRKKTTLISGDPGMGKSQIALDLAMRVTRGIGLPDHPAPPAPAGVMICENEDDWEEDVIPRLIAVGADRRLIRGFFAADLHTHEGVARLDKVKKKLEAETRTAVGALILSPYMACFGGGSAQESHMRQKLVEIERWQKEVDIAIIGVAHLGGTGDVAGPKTFKRAARGSWKVIIDEEDPETNPKKKRRLLVADKVNNTADDFAMAYRIKGVTLKESKIETSKIVWEDLTSLPSVAESEENITSPATLTGQFTEYLRDRLKDGPVEGRLLLADARKMGVSMSGVYEAKRRLRIANGAKGKKSAWELP